MAINGADQVLGESLEKPPYSVPSMAEIADLPWNGLNVVSTFSGCGGSCLGYRMAGYRVLWASEFIPDAQQIYKANHPDSFLDLRDIRKVAPEEILDQIGLSKGELDLMDGSPPCAAFSVSGKVDKGWGEVKKYSTSKQRVDDLFFEFARILKGLQPKVFVAENVAGLVIGKSKGYFLEILQHLGDCGYKVNARVLDAQWLGVPQRRKRLIFVGVRNDLNKSPVFPTPFPWVYSVEDAIGNITVDITPRYELVGKTLYLYERSVNFRGEFKRTLKSLGLKSGFFNHFRLRWGDPSVTILQSSTAAYHPAHPRTLTILELRRVCGFPDDFILSGSFVKQWERLGRAVPPLMMKEISAVIRDQILKDS